MYFKTISIILFQNYFRETLGLFITYFRAMLCYFNSTYQFKEQPIFIQYVKAIFLLFINVQFRLFYYYVINYLLSIFYYILDIFVYIKLIVNKVL